ncbi:hypothetical protein HYH03_002551 [Edaphochlamys debaryana]|uniref:Guanylate cyclase domain-containing protein n=1 Tax=Edaphochlamys debaryana TaxID=47281 RepID=A0A835YDH9_9CHLO|nr:hypothetical protein HYH03_002551 [Edaphochlamys debaryana]|eukprot:KAG2499612.1 hypothetical protein HYH03_002551 [Edaphochlamys debaryana]
MHSSMASLAGRGMDSTLALRRHSGDGGTRLVFSTEAGSTAVGCVLANTAAVEALQLREEQDVLSFLARSFAKDPSLKVLFQDIVKRLLQGQLTTVNHFVPGDFGRDRYFLSMRISPFAWRMVAGEGAGGRHGGTLRGLSPESGHLWTGDGLATAASASLAGAPGAGPGGEGGPGGVAPAMILELDVPYEGKELAARLQRDYMCLSHIPSIVTMFDVNGPGRLASAGGGTEAAGHGAPLRSPPSQRWLWRSPVPGSPAPEHVNHLKQLFAHEPAKLLEILQAVTEGTEYRGLIRMPARAHWAHEMDPALTDPADVHLPRLPLGADACVGTAPRPRSTTAVTAVTAPFTGSVGGASATTGGPGAGLASRTASMQYSPAPSGRVDAGLLREMQAAVMGPFARRSFAQGQGPPSGAASRGPLGGSAAGADAALAAAILVGEAGRSVGHGVGQGQAGSATPESLRRALSDSSKLPGDVAAPGARPGVVAGAGAWMEAGLSTEGAATDRESPLWPEGTGAGAPVGRSLTPRFAATPGLPTVQESSTTLSHSQVATLATAWMQGSTPVSAAANAVGPMSPPKAGPQSLLATDFGEPRTAEPLVTPHGGPSAANVSMGGAMGAGRSTQPEPDARAGLPGPSDAAQAAGRLALTPADVTAAPPSAADTAEAYASASLAALLIPGAHLGAGPGGAGEQLAAHLAAASLMLHLNRQGSEASGNLLRLLTTASASASGKLAEILRAGTGSTRSPGTGRTGSAAGSGSLETTAARVPPRLVDESQGNSRYDVAAEARAAFMGNDSGPLLSNSETNFSIEFTSLAAAHTHHSHALSNTGMAGLAGPAQHGPAAHPHAPLMQMSGSAAPVNVLLQAGASVDRPSGRPSAGNRGPGRPLGYIDEGEAGEELSFLLPKVRSHGGRGGNGSGGKEHDSDAADINGAWLPPAPQQIDHPRGRSGLPPPAPPSRAEQAPTVPRQSPLGMYPVALDCLPDGDSPSPQAVELMNTRRSAGSSPLLAVARSPAIAASLGRPRSPRPPLPPSLTRAAPRGLGSTSALGPVPVRLSAPDLDSIPSLDSAPPAPRAGMSARLPSQPTPASPASVRRGEPARSMPHGRTTNYLSHTSQETDRRLQALLKALASASVMASSSNALSSAANVVPNSSETGMRKTPQSTLHASDASAAMAKLAASGLGTPRAAGARGGASTGRAGAHGGMQGEKQLSGPGAADEVGGSTAGWKWHEIAVKPCFDPLTSASLILIIMTDVTSKVHAEERLARVLEAEHRLLADILPSHVVRSLVEMERNGLSLLRPIRDPAAVATQHESITVLFADIKGFTEMSKEVAPAVVMTFLNDLYTRFDSLTDVYGVYKVETIGDCYMVAGGLMARDEDGYGRAVRGEGNSDPLHAMRVVAFARAMLEEAAKVALPNTGEPVKLRVGIHSGPATSGVVGQKMPRFCLFGDTVNTASRMESTGHPGLIHVSAATRRLLPPEEDAEGWAATGGVEVKGKGRMDTFVWSPHSAVADRQRRGKQQRAMLLGTLSSLPSVLKSPQSRPGSAAPSSQPTNGQVDIMMTAM